jgi:hypothetical protein
MTPTPGGGLYASFNYPAALSQVVGGETIAPTLVNYDYSYRDIESWNLEIIIYTNPSGNLTNDSPYTYRQLHPAIFQESKTTINHQPVDIMTDKTAAGFGKLAFLIHGQYQATISLTGNDANGVDDLQATFNMVLNSWRWLVN